MKNLNRLHQILCLASSVAALLAYGIVAELSVFENTLHHYLPYLFVLQNSQN